MKREPLRLLALLTVMSIILLQAQEAQAIPSPHGISGTVYELDGITQAPEGISFSINDTTRSQFVQGKTGRPGSTGKYAASINGEDDDTIIVKVWNIEHSSNRTLTLQGVMREVNLLLNTTISPMPPEITSAPVTAAIEGLLYVYTVEAVDYNNDALAYSLPVAPLGMTMTDRVITWTPTNADALAGSHQVVVSVSDGTFAANQSFAVSVANTNDAPVITSVPVTEATEDQPYSYDANAIDEDGPGDTLIYLLTQAPAGMHIDSVTGLISWVPLNSDSDAGLRNVTVAVTDGNGGIDFQSFAVSVAKVNDHPEIISAAVTTATQDVPYIYAVKATDEDGDILQYSLQEKPQGMGINASTGLLTWTPTNSQVGNNQVKVRASDGRPGSYSEQSFIISASDTNDLPAIISIPATTAKQDSLYTYDAEATDPDNDSITYVLLLSPAGMAINNLTGLVTWTPTSHQTGYVDVVLGARDRNGTATQMFTILVQNVNDAPSINSVPITSTEQGTLYEYLAEAVDPDNDELTYSLAKAPSGMLLDAPSGYIVWMPGNDHVGNNSVTVVVSDRNATANQSFTISVENVNDAPNITSSPPRSASVKSLYAYDVNATDPDGDTIIYSLLEAPEGMLINSQSGLIIWTPDKGRKGSNVSVVVQANDSELATAQSFAVTVAKGKENEDNDDEKKDKKGEEKEKGPPSGGGGRGNPSISVSKLSQLIENSPVTEIDVAFRTPISGGYASVKAQLLPQRPQEVKSIQKRVYGYLELSPQNFDDSQIEEATVVFKVEKAWLSKNKVEPGNIALYRYGSKEWEELPTTKISEDNSFANYEAKTPGLSVFAMAVKSEESIEKINNEIQGFETAQLIQSAYSISGTILKSDKKSQVEKGTPFTIQNLNTSEIVEGKTGIWPSSPPGAFFIIVPGKIGHSLKITILGGGNDSENKKAEGTMIIEGDVDGLVLVADYKRGKASALNPGSGSKITGFIVLNDLFVGKGKSKILPALAVLAVGTIIIALIIKARRQRIKKKPFFTLSFLAVLLLLTLSQRISAPPIPHSVAGYIFQSDGVTQVPLGTSYSINDSSSGDFFRSKTSIPVPGLTGRYFETISGSDGDTVRVMAWNATHYGNTSVTLVGDMDSINVTLNLSRNPEMNVSILVPSNNTAYNVSTYFNATANISAVGAAATGCNATISFGNTFVLNISGMDSLNHSLGSIPLGQAVATSWNVSAQGAINTTLTVTAKCENEAVSLESPSHATASNITVIDLQGPSVSLMSPENNTQSGTNTVVFNYNVSDSSRISNCTLAINNLLNLSNSTAVVKSAVQNITQSLENGQYNWTVRCQDIAGNAGNGTNFNLTVNATVPVLTNLKLTSPVNLQAGGLATVWCNATVTVNRLLVNISRVNATFFDQTAALFNSTDDNNDYYTNASCSNLTAAADSTEYGCAFPVWYYANNASWLCRLTATDTNNASGFTTTATTMNELAALGAESLIDFGALAPTNTSNDTNLTLFNQGNKNINISVRGYGILQAGDNLSMSCGPDGNIAVENQRYSVTPSASYDAMRNLTNQSSLVLNFTLFQKTNDAQNGSEVNQTFWRIKVPTGVGGACNGTTVLLASIA